MSGFSPITRMTIPKHPLVDQLRFTRREFMRAIRGISAGDAVVRIMPMNCLSRNVGHLAWQEQRYFLHFGQGITPFPDIAKEFAYGAPASTPSLDRVIKAWKTITRAADPWLDTLTSDVLSPRRQQGQRRRLYTRQPSAADHLPLLVSHGGEHGHTPAAGQWVSSPVRGQPRRLRALSNGPARSGFDLVVRG